ncbi:hypothetical protein MNBD_NITROSPINAE03-1560 [hydrothermal vent metagenome]|uniref:NIL domain-containing protein n=1 Tax=hydrothermal vent metagenome TaxID=652676 RepID=A0A3B1CA48_9ZZZZ
MAQRFFSFTFPEDLVQEPIIYSLVRRYGLDPIVFKALVTSSGGWLVVQLAGEDQNIDRAIIDLRCRGAHVVEGDDKLLELVEPSTVSSVKVQLRLPQDKVIDPIYSAMIINHDVVINIRQAKIDRDQGTVNIEISGTLKAIDNAIESLKKEGIVVGPIEGNVIE